MRLKQIFDDGHCCVRIVPDRVRNFFRLFFVCFWIIFNAKIKTRCLSLIQHQDKPQVYAIFYGKDGLPRHVSKYSPKVQTPIFISLFINKGRRSGAQNLLSIFTANSCNLSCGLRSRYPFLCCFRSLWTEIFWAILETLPGREDDRRWRSNRGETVVQKQHQYS